MTMSEHDRLEWVLAEDLARKATVISVNGIRQYRHSEEAHTHVPSAAKLIYGWHEHNHDLSWADIPDVYFVYRHYDMDGRLLYVGITNDATKRENRHKQESAFYSEIIRSQTTYEYLPSKRSALDREREIIQTERPIHNVAHNTRRTP